MMDIVTLVMACSTYPDYSITNAMVQVASQNKALLVTPASGNAANFATTQQAASFAEQQIQQGNPVALGVTQMPNRWLKSYHVNPTDVLRPCKNVVIATEILNDTWNKCLHIVSDPSSVHDVQACALSMFKSGDPQAGLDYAQSVIDYASAHPFSKVAAPALQRWEKYAAVPKVAGAKGKTTPTAPAADKNTTSDSTDDATTSSDDNNTIAPASQ